MAAAAYPVMRDPRERNYLRRQPALGERPAAARAAGPVMKVNDPAAAAPAVAPPEKGETPAGWSPLGVLTQPLPPANPSYNPTLTPGEVSAPPAMAEDPDAQLKHYLELLQSTPQDTNGRGRSALRMLGQPVPQSDSLGYTIGAKLAGVGSALLDPSVDERTIDRPEQLARAQAGAQAEAAGEKRTTERRESKEEGEQRRARTKQIQVETEELPKMNAQKAAERTQTRLLSQLRTAKRYKRGENPALDQQIDAAGMAVSDFEPGGKFQWHTSGGQVYTMDSNTGNISEGASNDKSIVDASKVPDPKTGLLPYQAAQLASREKLTKWGIDSREKIAGQQMEIQRARVKMSADQFKVRYPGAGLELTPDDIAAQAKALDMLPEDVAQDAIKQGYGIKGMAPTVAAPPSATKGSAKKTSGESGPKMKSRQGAGTAPGVGVVTGHWGATP